MAEEKKSIFKTLPTKVSRGISMCIFSDPGKGKTTAAATLPVGETLFISCEAGVAPLYGTGHVVMNVLEAMVNTWKDVLVVMNELYKDIRTGNPNYKFVKNVVIDNVSELSDQITACYVKTHNKGTPELREYGETAWTFREWIHNWRDLVEMGINVVLNAWEADYEITATEGTIITKTCPKVGRSNIQSICGLVDIVGHLEVDEKSQRRFIRIAPSRQYMTKTQFKGLCTGPNGEMTPGEPANLPEIIRKVKEYDYSKQV